jgi:glucokinase-like ROK family protein
MFRDALPRLAPAFSGRNGANVKAHNLQAILLTLLHQGSVSRARLAELTGLSTTTITNLIAELLNQAVVMEEEIEQRHGVGRPRIPVSLIPEARFAVGIHLDVDNVRVSLADLRGNLRTTRIYRHTPDADVYQLLERAAVMSEAALAEAGVTNERVVGCGVGASGLVNSETGVNTLAPNLGWRNLPIRDILSRRLNLPVIVDNNVRAMALGESMFGIGRDVNSLAFVYVRVGVGAGLVVGGQVYRGSHAGAGEIGHTTMIPLGGMPCRCGNTGCLETVVSEPALIRHASTIAAKHAESLLGMELANTSDAMGLIFSAARAGDQDVRDMLDECSLYMGTALANLIDVINPNMIIVGGVLAKGADVLLPQIAAVMRSRAFAGLGQQVDLRPTCFGSEVGVLGAAALALDRYFYRQVDSTPGSGTNGTVQHISAN